MLEESQDPAGSLFEDLINNFLFNAESVQQMAHFSKKRPLSRSLELAPKFVTRAQIFTALIIVHVNSVNSIVEASALRVSVSNKYEINF